MTSVTNELNNVNKENSHTPSWLDKLCWSFTKYHPQTGTHRIQSKPKKHTLRSFVSHSSLNNQDIDIAPSQNDPINWKEDCFSWLINGSCVAGVLLLSNYCF